MRRRPDPQSLEFRRALNPKPLVSSFNRLALPFAATLELVTEKSNAHSSNIASVAFSPDGKTIVSGSRDKTLKVWGALAFLNCRHPTAD